MSSTIIIGGGLSGLTCGLALAKRGHSVTVLSGGPSTLMFSGGSMELLGAIDGQPVTAPLDAIASLPDCHPYRKIGAERIADLAGQARELLNDVGITTAGDATANHWRITPMGIAKPAWLTLNEYFRIDDLSHLPIKKIALMAIRGFFDQPNGMLAQGLRDLGFEVKVVEFTTDEIASLRRSPTEMRATTLAKRLLSHNALQRIANQVNSLSGDAELVLLPSVFGQKNDDSVRLLQDLCDKPLRLVATLPPAVVGMRIQAQLLHYFMMLGGDYRTGEAATGGIIEGGRLTGVTTAKSGSPVLTADNYVLATGSFVSRGIAADARHIYETVLDLDVDADEDRDRWTHFGVLEPQNYWTYGVTTDETLRCFKQGTRIENLHAIGSVLSGHNAVKMGDGTGVSLLSALAVAQDILAGK